MLSHLRTLSTGVLGRIAPRLLWKHRIDSWGAETGEVEEVLLPWVCDRHKMSIDVGAAAGNYTMRMLLYSSHVIAFEPRPEDADRLQQLFQSTRMVTVERAALSDAAGGTMLRRPDVRPMLSTIEAENHLSDSPSADPIPVNRKTLDEFKFHPIGFIKIDVEGHEPSVLAGAKQTIERERPTFLIEIEKVHNPTSFDRICASLRSAEYVGFFLLGGELHDIGSFNFDAYQNRNNLVEGKRLGTYVNNFLFLPEERSRHFSSDVSPRLSLKKI
jgi:FkbM family methyltransferase